MRLVQRYDTFWVLCKRIIVSTVQMHCCLYLVFDFLFHFILERQMLEIVLT